LKDLDVNERIILKQTLNKEDMKGALLIWFRQGSNAASCKKGN
jgi:hypothetical protein